MHHDATTRAGALRLDDRSIATPGILWYASDRIEPPSFAGMLLSQSGDALSHAGSFFRPLPQRNLSIPPSFVYPDALPAPLHEHAAAWNRRQATDVQLISAKARDAIDGDATMYTLTNARELFARPRRFVEAVVAVREAIGYQAVLYTPGLGRPAELALLAYCTVDLVDSLSLIEAAREGTFLSIDGAADADAYEAQPCRCPGCTQNEGFDALLRHNYNAAWSEMVQVRHAIAAGTLRSLVERRCQVSPHHLSVLRLLDGEYAPFQEARYPVQGGNVSATPLSLSRPDVERFRHRVLTRYRKPSSAAILLLLPCSARKPYSTSRSHRRFADAIAASGNPYVVHRMVVTSPLGIVPIELDGVYPAAHYDVSVIGRWSRDEQAMVTDMLHCYLKRNEYDMVLQHLPEDIASFLDIDAVNTCRGHPTARSSLAALTEQLRTETASYEGVPWQTRKRERVAALLRYQFGSAGLLDDAMVKGRYPRYRVFEGDEQLGMFVPQRGLFSLTLDGARWLADLGSYWVEIEDFTPLGSVFAVGVVDADSSIRCGDEVVVVHDGGIRGVGEATMNGDEMRESDNGEAVKVRHHP